MEEANRALEQEGNIIRKEMGEVRGDELASTVSGSWNRGEVRKSENSPVTAIQRCLTDRDS